MSAHLSEADLLEIHYLERTGEHGIAAHLAACGRCTESLASIRERLRRSAEIAEPDEAFFERQRDAVMRRLHEPRARAARPWRFAAAAALVLAISGVAVHRTASRTAVPVTATQAITTAAVIPAETPTIPRDVWETDELTDLHPLVDWESWEETSIRNGGRS